MSIDLNKILIEWSFRTDRGYPKITKSEDLEILYEIVEEEYGKKVAIRLLENVEDSISEVSLGLNNSSLRHENEHEKYTKRLIKILKSGGKLKMERKVSYMDESEDDPDRITIPKNSHVKVDVNDDLIGKLISALRGVKRYGPDFPEENKKAQKALKRAEKVFTKDDGSYRRIIPVTYKGSKVLIKLHDISKDTVTDDDEDQDTDYSPEKDKESDKKKKDRSSKNKKPEEPSEKDNVKKENDDNSSDTYNALELPPEVIEYFGDSYDDGPENPEVMNEDSESDDAEEDTDKPSKYVDRRDDGKDTKYPDREYKEFDPESDEEEEAGDDDYRQDNGDEEEEETEEEKEGEGTEGEEENVEELNEQAQLEKKKEIYKFNFEL